VTSAYGVGLGVTGALRTVQSGMTAAQIRKLRDGAGGTVGAFIRNASPTAGMQQGQRDTLLGYRVEIDASVVSLASDAKVVAFGDWSAY